MLLYKIIMSKKNKSQHSKVEEHISLANWKVAKKITVVLPESIEKAPNGSLLEGYLRVKLGNKKVHIGQSFIALFKGR